MVWSVVIDVGDRFADRTFIQGGLLVNQSGHQSGVAELVDAARQALGVLEDAGHGTPALAVHVQVSSVKSWPEE